LGSGEESKKDIRSGEIKIRKREDRGGDGGGGLTIKSADENVELCIKICSINGR
jgi:hypothetical protein